MSENFWADKYPEGVTGIIHPERFRNIPEVLGTACKRFGQQPAFSCLGGSLSYQQLWELSGQFAAYLQHHTDLQPGERIAIQLPNITQYPVALFGALRAGLVVVNTNPLYTARELTHQLQDSGARALVCLANGAHVVEQVLPQTVVAHVFITELGDLLPVGRRALVNLMVRYLKRLVPAYDLAQSLSFRQALLKGARCSLQAVEAQPEELAILQYTGGTTGVAKGAMLSHRNLIANMLQCHALLDSKFREGQEIMVAPLPLYHIYAFTLHCMLMVLVGGHNVLIPNPKDIKALVSTLAKVPFTSFVGLNTLFVALCQNSRFRQLDFSPLASTFSGGMALHPATARDWEAVTRCPVSEGYGLTEASPVVAVNPLQNIQPGTIGIPLPSTECKVVDDENTTQPLGCPGELCVRGPQVMQGYWLRPEATAEVLDAEGWLRTGDIALIRPDGYLCIVDRKKDMILVSGFNVYPNELEAVLSTLPGVTQCAAIGVPDERTGEAIKVFVVKQPEVDLTPAQVRQHLYANLTGYKRPHYIEFRDSLPTTNVGKISRLALREQEQARLTSSPP